MSLRIQVGDTVKIVTKGMVVSGQIGEVMDIEAGYCYVQVLGVVYPFEFSDLVCVYRG